MGILANAMKWGGWNGRATRRRQPVAVRGIESLEQRALLSAAAMGIGQEALVAAVPIGQNVSGWVAVADDTSELTIEVATAVTDQLREVGSAAESFPEIELDFSSDSDAWLDSSIDFDIPSGSDDPDLGTPVIVDTPETEIPCAFEFGSIVFDSSSETVVINGTICDDIAEVVVLEGAGTDGEDLLHVVLNDGLELSQDLEDVDAIVFYALEGNDFFDNDSSVASSAWGGEGVDVFYGGRGVDVFHGGDQTDFLYGAGGNDRLEGDDGDDELYGQSDDDVLRGGNGNDYLAGSGGDDVLYGQAGDDEVRGNDGNDMVNGGDGDDHLYGGGDADMMYGVDGDDVLEGGPDDDVMYGGDGEDQLSGQKGDDELHGGADDDCLEGGNGADSIYAGNGNDEAHGGSGSDFISGGDHQDVIYGDGGDDILNGGSGRDEIFGGEGNDDLYGNGGDDELHGMDGDDGMFGGDGEDSLNGGDNEDRFLYQDDDTLIDKTSADAKIRFYDGDGSWSEEEIEAIDQAFSVLHHFTGDATLLERANGNKMKFRREADSNGGSCSGALLGSNNDYGRIRLYNEAFLGCTPIEQVVFHEIGHNWEDESSIWSDFKDLSDWTKRDKSGDADFAQSGDGDWWHDTSADFASDYGANNPHDDFAEIFALFFMNEAGLGFDDSVGSTTDGMANNAAIISDVQDKYDLFEGWVNSL
ncbi:MAG: calcium-binding protein [Planctomycetaceae bacterium]